MITIATGYWVRTVPLLTTSASAHGPWVLMGRLLSPTVTIEGLEAGGVVSIRVSNVGEETPPADADLGAPHNVLGNVTADIGAGLGGAFTWVRAIKTAGGSPTTTTITAQAQIAK